MLRRNVGGIDRILRVTLGAVFFVAGLFLLAGKTRPGLVLAVVGLMALITGIVRFCVLYIPFGISTARPADERLSPLCNCDESMEEMQGYCCASKPLASEEEEASLSAA